MAAVRSRGNKSTEQALIRIFRQRGITGWRRGSLIEGKPDFVFPKMQTAVFVDGCFWHGCTKHKTIPVQNRQFWKEKIEANNARDKLVNGILRKKGWKVIRLWEHDMKRDESRVLARIKKALRV